MNAARSAVVFRPDTLFTAGYDYPCTRDYMHDN